MDVAAVALEEGVGLHAHLQPVTIMMMMMMMMVTIMMMRPAVEAAVVTER